MTLTTVVKSCDPGGDRGDALGQAEVSQAASGVNNNTWRRKLSPPRPVWHPSTGS